MTDDNAGSDLGGENEVARAFEIIKQAMIDDEPGEPGSYAHTWHCNIAMAFFDQLMWDWNDILVDGYTDAGIHEVCNDAASRFMKLAFDVETSN